MAFPGYEVSRMGFPGHEPGYECLNGIPWGEYAANLVRGDGTF